MDAPRPYLTIKVDGFRSLQNVEIPLKQGLNVFVGPNGSGKTNVMAATEFISTFISDGVHAAIAKNGGASRVFSNEQLLQRNHNPTIVFSVNGVIDVPKIAPRHLSFHADDDEEEADYVPLEFSYFLKLSLDKSRFEIAVDLEQVSWRKMCEGGEVATLSASAIDPEKNSSTAKLSPEEFYRKYMGPEMADYMLKRMNEDEGPFTPKSHFHKLSKDGRSLLGGVTLFTLDEIMAIKSTLSFHRSYNISPSKVREPEDIASSKEIESDGSGTITRLYELRPIVRSKSKAKKSSQRSKSTYDKIINSFKQVNDQIYDFEVSPNLRTGFIDSFILFGKNRIKLPLQSVSDGTVKWLAMLTSIRSGTFSSYCIEEPENYLHPAAQRLFIKTMRNVSKDIRNSFYIISTHSETIVNAIDVEELRICEYEEDGTQIRLVSSPDRVKEAINKTGFGLGFLYANQRL